MIVLNQQKDQAINTDMVAHYSIYSQSGGGFVIKAQFGSGWFVNLGRYATKAGAKDVLGMIITSRLAGKRLFELPEGEEVR